MSHLPAGPPDEPLRRRRRGQRGEAGGDDASWADIVGLRRGAAGGAAGDGSRRAADHGPERPLPGIPPEPGAEGSQPWWARRSSAPDPSPWLPADEPSPPPFAGPATGSVPVAGHGYGDPVHGDQGYGDQVYGDQGYGAGGYLQGEVVDDGRGSGGYDRPASSRGDYPETAYIQPTYSEPSNPGPSYREPSYPEPTYPQGYSEQGHPEPGFSGPRYPQPVPTDPRYPQPGYPQPVAEPTYPGQGRPAPGFPASGYPTSDSPAAGYPVADPYPGAEPGYPVAGRPEYPGPVTPARGYADTGHVASGYPDPTYPESSYRQPEPFPLGPPATTPSSPISGIPLAAPAPSPPIDLPVPPVSPPSGVPGSPDTAQWSFAGAWPQADSAVHPLPWVADPTPMPRDDASAAGAGPGSGPLRLDGGGPATLGGGPGPAWRPVLEEPADTGDQPVVSSGQRGPGAAAATPPSAGADPGPPSGGLDTGSWADLLVGPVVPPKPEAAAAAAASLTGPAAAAATGGFSLPTLGSSTAAGVSAEASPGFGDGSGGERGATGPAGSAGEGGRPTSPFGGAVAVDPTPSGATRRIARVGEEPADPPSSGRAGRNLPAAIAVGILLAGTVAASLMFRKEAFVAVAAIAVVLGVWELAGAFAQRNLQPPVIPISVGAVGMLVSAFVAGGEGLLVSFVLTAFGVLLWRLIDGLNGALPDIAAGVFVAAYVPLLAGFAVLMLSADDGVSRVLVFLAVVVASDTGGYLAGVLFGKHPMAPAISPKKTWEGFAGSAIGCMVVGTAGVTFLLDGPWWAGALLGAAGVVSATVGDLSESLIKRDLGLKDMAKTLPGHGGVMDRLDSLLPTAPVAFVLLTLFV